MRPEQIVKEFQELDEMEKFIKEKKKDVLDRASKFLKGKDSYEVNRFWEFRRVMVPAKEVHYVSKPYEFIRIKQKKQETPEESLIADVTEGKFA